ncbi:MAG: T9SS type A sorting domain-containing protein [Candidatus Marinimicrobia bacterium]|nr:T9SS type A sorting domain-containing protein [Candidatus Neomarinimicrobiota bacterium]
MVGSGGDTLSKEYILPDEQPFRNYFTVREAEYWGYADSMRSMAVFRRGNGMRDTLLLHGGGPEDEGNYFHGSYLGETDETDPLYLESLASHTIGDADACSYFYRFYGTACIDTPAFRQIPLSTENDGRWIADELKLSLCNNRDPGRYVLEIFGCVSHEDSVWSDQFDSPEDGYYTASYDICSSEGGTDPPLPITLSAFSAKPGDGTVELSWSTESETENSHFLIYRDDAVIGRVEGAGTVSEPQHYSFTDNYAAYGNVYTYELADVSFGSVETKHGEVEVELVAGTENADNFILNAAYPNPFNPRTIISMRCETGSDAVVTVYNTQGVPVKELINGYVEPGTYEITWDAAGMPSGVYIVRMRAGNVLRSRKIVLLK